MDRYLCTWTNAIDGLLLAACGEHGRARVRGGAMPPHRHSPAHTMPPHQHCHGNSPAHTVTRVALRSRAGGSTTAQPEVALKSRPAITSSRALGQGQEGVTVSPVQS